MNDEINDGREGKIYDRRPLCTLQNNTLSFPQTSTQIMVPGPLSHKRKPQATSEEYKTTEAL